MPGPYQTAGTIVGNEMGTQASVWVRGRTGVVVSSRPWCKPIPTGFFGAGSAVDPFGLPVMTIVNAARTS